MRGFFEKMYIFPSMIHTNFRRGTTLYDVHHRFPPKDEAAVKGGSKMDENKKSNKKSTEFADELNMDNKNSKSGSASTSSNTNNTTNCR